MLSPMSKPGPKLLLFDVDGTLLLSHGGSLRAMTRAARRLFGPEFSLDEVDRNGQLDPHIIATALELNGVRATPQQLRQFQQRYVKELRAETAVARALAGVHELIDRLRTTEGILLGCVSGNYPEAARIKLQAVEIDPAWFVANGFGGQAPTRSELVQLAMQEAAKITSQPISGDRVIVIGDTPRDVQSAKANGCLAVAVATGNFSAEALAAAGADVVLLDLVRPEPLWAMLGADGGLTM
jgi:phosphoglycolate phosphatase-like HAD superfamily hydrolase